MLLLKHRAGDIIKVDPPEGEGRNKACDGAEATGQTPVRFQEAIDSGNDGFSQDN